jgi:hypothetical protein
MEIEVRPRVFTMALAVITVVCLTAIGYQASPRDETGRPILLLPDVRAVELYRRAATGWVEDWRALADELALVVAEDGVSLLTRSRQAQRVFDRAVALTREVDATEAPPALLGLQDLASRTSNNFVEASAAIARWLSAPSSENRTAAEEALGHARTALAELEANEWITPAVEGDGR